MSYKIEGILSQLQASIAALTAALAPQEPSAVTAPFPAVHSPGTSGAIRLTLKQQAEAKGLVPATPQAVTKTAPAPAKKGTAPKPQAPPSKFPAKTKPGTKRQKNYSPNVRVNVGTSSKGNQILRINGENLSLQQTFALLRSQGMTVTLQGAERPVDREEGSALDFRGNPVTARVGIDQSVVIKHNGLNYHGIIFFSNKGDHTTIFGVPGLKKGNGN